MRMITVFIFLSLLLLMGGCAESVSTTTKEVSTTTEEQTTTSTTEMITTTSEQTTTTEPYPSDSRLIYIDHLSGGEEFAGYGLVSGGTDTLLMDYEPSIRQDILNYLFKDNYGPEIKLLKVEIGGGGNDTNISNASFMPIRDEINPYAGYDWKLIKEVKETNPNVKIEGLHWTLPNWVKTPSDEAYYIYNWVKMMRDVHGITVDYIGGQRNEEEPIIMSYAMELRKLLNENGFESVKIVAADSVYNKWAVSDLMMNSSLYNDAIDIIGAHYIGDQEPSLNTKLLRKPIWASEEPGWNPDYHTYGNVKVFLSNYVDKNISGMQTWGMSASIYENSWWHMIGIITAKHPWSGYWQAGKNNWAIAHINQFSEFGCQFVDSASGKLDDGKSYFVTTKSPENDDYNLMVETFDANEDQNIVVRLSDGMPQNKKVYVWTSIIGSNNLNYLFFQENEITPVNGQFTYTLKPGRVYNFVTTTGHGKEGLNVTIPQNTAWNLPVLETFDDQTAGQRPQYFVDIEGTFQVEEALGGRDGNALRQTAIGAPVRWYGAGTDPYPYTLYGFPYWRDYHASIDVLLENEGYVDLAIRASEAQMKERLSRKGYYIRLHSDGEWELIMIKLIQASKSNYVKVLDSGNVGPIDLNSWYNIGVSADGDQISAYFNGVKLTTVTDSTHRVGNIFLSTSDYQYAQFDNLRIDPINK